MLTKNELRRYIEEHAPKRSAWDRGVNAYAFDLIDNLDYGDDEEITDDELDLLNGASSWSQYSDGGCALCYDCDIAERLCTPSELKKNRGGEWNPNRYETWLDVQARALNQAANRVSRAARKLIG